jgi:hypothetical protein
MHPASVLTVLLRYLESLQDNEDEPVFEGPIDFSFEEDSNLKIDDIKKLILKYGNVIG